MVLYCRYAINEQDPYRLLEPYINNVYRRYLERLIRQVGVVCGWVGCSRAAWPLEPHGRLAKAPVEAVTLHATGKDNALSSHRIQYTLVDLKHRPRPQISTFI